MPDPRADDENPMTEPTRCVVVVSQDLPPGRAANAAAVVALTLGQRHPRLVGEPLIDGDGLSHPGLIPIGIPVLGAPAALLNQIRDQALVLGCDVVDFPAQGQATTDYAQFQASVKLTTGTQLRYVAVALVGAKKRVGKVVGGLSLLK